MRIAKCECYRCHSIVPKTEARQKIVSENSGRSGISFSVGLTRNARPRMNTGRQYYSNRKVWICKSCDSGGGGSNFFAILGVIGLIYLAFKFLGG